MRGAWKEKNEVIAREREEIVMEMERRNEKNNAGEKA